MLSPVVVARLFICELSWFLGIWGTQVSKTTGEIRAACPAALRGLSLTLAGGRVSRRRLERLTVKYWSNFQPTFTEILPNFTGWSTLFSPGKTVSFLLMTLFVWSFGS